jgi:hypothetical protein
MGAYGLSAGLFGEDERRRDRLRWSGEYERAIGVSRCFQELCRRGGGVARGHTHFAGRATFMVWRGKRAPVGAGGLRSRCGLVARALPTPVENESAFMTGPKRAETGLGRALAEGCNRRRAAGWVTGGFVSIRFRAWGAAQSPLSVAGLSPGRAFSGKGSPRVILFEREVYRADHARCAPPAWLLAKL